MVVKTSNLYKAKLNFNTKLVSPGYKHTNHDILVKKIIRTFKGIGIESKPKKHNGGSDANIFNSLGIKAVTISYGGQYIHTTKEQVKIKDMEKMVQFIINFVSITKRNS